jgi:putative ABC transport system permease protein
MAKNEFAGNAAVRSVAISSRVPGEWKNIVQIGVIPADVPAPDTLAMSFLGIDADFLDTYEVELTEGRNFSTQIVTDSTAVLLNETAAKALGWDSSIGKPITVMVPWAGYEARVIGVVKDFHFRSLYDKIGPLVMGHLSNPIQPVDYFTVKLSGVNLLATLEFLESVHEQFDHATPFEYNFLNERLQDFYKTDERVGRLFGIAAELAIFIACIGLFGLAAFTTEQRTKEIGVRKVLGASVAGILLLLSKDFTRLVVVAFAVATPLSCLAMKHWIQNFAYHIGIGWEVFALSGGLALVIALLTVSLQALKAALANPVDSLRYE